MPPNADDNFVHSVIPFFRRRNLYRLLWLIAITVLILSITSWFFIPAIVLTLILSFKNADADRLLAKKVREQFSSQLTEVEKNSQALMRPIPLDGVVGSLGDRRFLSVIAQGTYGSYDIRLLNQTAVYKPGSGNGSYSRGYRILEISTRQDFYHVFIDSKKNDRKLLSTAMTILSLSVKNNDVLKVEGDVNKYFNIYVPDGDQYKSLITLTPDKLLAIREYGKHFDIEFINNKIYIITNDKIRNLKDILAYQQSVLDLVNNIGVDVKRERYDINNNLTVKTPTVLTF